MATKEQNQSFAVYMKSLPNQFPDSVRRPWRGCGAGERDMARKMSGGDFRKTSTYFRGVMGGLMAVRAGYPCLSLDRLDHNLTQPV